MLFLVSTIINPPRLTFRAASESNLVASPVYRGFSPSRPLLRGRLSYALQQHPRPGQRPWPV